MAASQSNPYGRVYLVTNLVSGLRYIGQTTTSIELRWQAHCNPNSGCLALARAIAKHGRDAFTVCEIGAASAKDELDALEARLIAELGTQSPHGYNIRSGGARGKWSQEEHRRRAELMAKPEHLQKMRDASQAMWQRPDVRGRISSAIREGLANPEVRERRSRIAKEASERDEVKVRRSVAQSARFKDPEQRSRLAELNRARAKDPQHRARMSEIATARQADPSVREAVSSSLRELWKDPEYRRRMTAAIKAGKLKKKQLSSK